MTSQADLTSFANYLSSSRRILALVGAGLSASSGIPTFRGAGGLWRQHRTKELASSYAFNQSPGTVWQFYGERRHWALTARPNQAHYALAELARKKKDFIMITQNVDGLSERAGHPLSQLYRVHGSLFSIRCTSCDYFQRENFIDPIVPPHENIAISALPHCPICQSALLRPGVVWFGERLPEDVTNAIETWISTGPVDLILVIGTSLSAFPAAEYVELARAWETRVAVINTDREDEPHGGIRDGDWFFHGDAAVIVPEMLKSIISSPLLTSLDPSVATDDEVVRYCSSDPSRKIIHHMQGGDTVVQISQNAVVKFGYGVSANEANNQRIAHQLVDPTIVRVPTVYRFIQAGDIGYIVMEFFDGVVDEYIVDSIRREKIARVIAHLADIKSRKVGPLAGGSVRGQLWTEDLEFTPTSLPDVEKYYSRVLRPQNLELDGAETVLCHLDIAARNIIWLRDDSIVLLDWQSAGFYPQVFEYCALRVNQRAPGDLNSCFLDAFRLTSNEKDQAELILQAWSKFQRYYCGPKLRLTKRKRAE